MTTGAQPSTGGTRFLFEPPVSDEAAWEKVMGDGAASLLASARDRLAELTAFEIGTVEPALSWIVEAAGVKPKELFQPLRVALTGTTVSPGIFESVAALGREETLGRIDAALLRLEDGGAGRTG